MELAYRESAAPAITEMPTYERLVFLLDDKHSGVIRDATAALSRIAQFVDGAKAIVEAKVLDHVFALLQSLNSEVRRWTCVLLRELAVHESTVVAILELKLCVPLVSLLSDEDSKMARWVNGAEAMVEAKTLDQVLVLLESPNTYTRKWTCKLVGTLAGYESTGLAILKLKPFPQLVSLIRDADAETRNGAIFALHAIGKRPDGIEALANLDGDMREWLVELSHTQLLDLDVQLQAHSILDNIAWYKHSVYDIH
ncbi:armadillo-type protein [Mycena galopus ATCC 62051]|nr:armadillo-type protein [Mycena galopus ATCC 62051]